MNPQNLIPRTTCPKTMARRLTTARATRLLPLLLLLLLAPPAAVQAQFNYTTTNGTITITGYTGSGGALIVPGTINDLPVAGIGANAFFFCYSLTSVTIPNSVTSIGDYAFQGCMRLTNVTIGSGVVCIGTQAFYQCSDLTSVTIPNSVTNIGDSAFNNCGSLANVTIGDGVASIGDGAFVECTNLTAITVGPLNSFYSSVAGVLFDKSQTTLIQCPDGQGGGYTIPNGVTGIGDYAFSPCTHLTSITIPNSVTNLGAWAFFGCSSLITLTVPDSVVSIGRGAFNGCTSLASVTIPSALTSIADYAFASCGSLASVTIPNSVTNIGDSAFSGCGLISVTIPNRVTSIGDGAFYGSRLSTITIPSSVTSIGNTAFITLTTITVDALNSVYSSVDGVLFNKSQTSLIEYPGANAASNYAIPNGVTNIAELAFWSCASLASVTFPNSVTSIGEGAFGECYSLTSVYFQGNAPSAGSSAFQDDNRATVYYLPGTTGWGSTFGGRPTVRLPGVSGALQVSISPPSVVSAGAQWQVDGGAWQDGGATVSNLSAGAHTITFSSVTGWVTPPSQVVNVSPNQTTTAAGTYGGFNYTDYTTNNGTITITGYTGLGGAVTIPSEINALPVSSIGTNAFFNQSSLTSVSIPDSVTNIGAGAFENCSSLTSVTIPNSVTSIGDAAFEACFHLAAATIPDSVTSIGDYAFFGCSLANATIPNSVTNIGQGAFSAGCSSITVDALNSFYSSFDGVLFDKSQSTLLAYPAGKAETSYSIPSSVTSIGGDAFAMCGNLTSITIPNSVTNIGYQAFWSCYRLTSATIPGSVTTVGDSAFACYGLTNVAIGNGVASIGDDAFSGASLSTVTIPNSVTNIGVSPFYYCLTLTAITVDPLNSFYSSVDGVLFDKRQTTLLEYPAGKIANYTIPDSVTSIGDSAFADVPWNLKSITIGSSVTNIGDSAFSSCTLGSVSIPNSVTSIGEWAFAFGLLTNITLPNSLTSIRADTFYACPYLTSVTIPNGVTSIGDQAFEQCNSLTSVYFEGNAPSLGSNVFFFDNNAAVYYLQNTTGWGATFGGLPAFLWDPLLQAVYTANYGAITITKYRGSGGAVSIPSMIGGLAVTSIGAYAFADAGLTSVTIPDSVTSIGNDAFSTCAGLTSVTIGSGVTSIGVAAFYECGNLSSVTIPDSVTSIGDWAFRDCTGLTNVAISGNVATIADDAFSGCTGLTGVYFGGNAPVVGSAVFLGDNQATVYYLPGTTGWGPSFCGLPTRPWGSPSILAPPLTQTAEAGSLAGFWVEATNIPPAGSYQWYFDATNALGGATNSYLELANVQPAQAGAYTVVVTNLYGAVTSAPALLSVIAAVERRMVPALNLTADVGSFLQLEYVNGFGSGAQWLSLTNVTTESTPQLYFDLSEPLPAQRFYRAWQTNGPQPTLNMSMATEIPLTGAIGSSVRIDYINQFSPTNAWVTLDTVTLTNSPQLYFDVSMFGQPTRLYRLVAVP